MTRAFQNPNEEFVSRGTLSKLYIGVKEWICKAGNTATKKIWRNKK
tara:strand:- start:2687 stop:2824 length:138 start_codon:yes stop_codon:yes gene_type:complete